MRLSLALALESAFVFLSAWPATADSAASAVAISATGRPDTGGHAQPRPPVEFNGGKNLTPPLAIDTHDQSAAVPAACSNVSLGDNASLNGFVPFPSSYAWNTDISLAPLDPNNAAITSAAGFAGLHLHHDFSSVAGGNYGIPYVVVDSSSTPLVPINVIDYADQSDVAFAPYPITAPIEGSPADCDGWPDTYVGDSHVLVLDRHACMLYETFNTHRCNGAWNASSETIWDLQSSEQRPWGWTSADAAGLPIFPGLVRYDEVAAGAINHAIRFTMQVTKNDANGGYFVEPATHAAGVYWGVSNVMGMRIRLKASFDISGYSAANQAILTAMKQYGMILADNGGYFYFQGVPDPRWNDDDLENLDSIQSSNFEVVQMDPAFPGWDTATAPTGQPPTINSFTASAATVAAGTPVTLTWSTSNDSYDFIDLLGGVHGGSVTTTPTATATYTLNATNQYGPSTAQVTVNVSQTIQSQTIAFGTLSNQPVSAAPFAVTATASSGLTVSFNSQTKSVCTVSNATVTLIAVGTCTVQATQAGNTTYAEATPINQSFQVTPASQTITFGALSNEPLGAAPLTVSASASSGLTVSLASTTTAVCTVSVTTVTLVAVGACTIQATQAGNNTTYAAATPVSQSFQVTPSPLSFIPITPCRIADTRYANGAFGSPSLVGGATRSFTIPSSSCSIPTTAEAYSLNVTVVPQGPLDYLTVWPSGAAQPMVSTLNSVDGRIKANAAITAAGTSGAVSVYATNTTDLVLDIDGYFVPAGSDASALAFYPLTPCRVADTRYSSFSSLGPPSLSAGQSRSFAVLSSNCNVPSTAQAYSLNFTAVPPGALNYITTYPTGTTMPLTSTLNDLTGTIVANAAIVPAGTGGAVRVYSYSNTDLLIDINGYFAPPGTGGLSLYNLTPCRVLDSRVPAPGTPPFTGEKDVNVTASGCGAPSSAQAYVFNATVAPPGPMNYLTLWPQGGTQPVVSTLNALDGAITSNMALVPTTNGSISSYVYVPSTTYLILDVFGYFAP